MNLIHVILLVPLLSAVIIAAMQLRESPNRYFGYVSPAMYAAMFVISLVGLSISVNAASVFNLANLQPALEGNNHINISFRASAPQFTFLMIISMIAFAKSLIDLGAERKTDPRDFLSSAMLFLSFAGLVLAENLLTILVFFFISGFSILYTLRNRSMRSFAKISLVFTIGAISLLSALMIFWKSSGSFSVELINDAIVKGYLTGPLYHAAQLLLLTGLLCAACIFPFHRWIAAEPEADAAENGNVHLLFYLPGAIMLTSVFSQLLGSAYILAAIWIALISIIYMLLLALNSKGFESSLRYIILSQFGLVFISVLSGNPASGLFLISALTASSMLIQKSNALIKNEQNGNGIHYCFFTASALLFAGIPLSSVFIGYAAVLNKLNTMQDPPTKLVLTIITILIVFTSSYMSLRNFLFTKQNSFKKSYLPEKNKIIEYAGVVILTIMLVSFVSSTNPFDFSSNWILRQLGMSFPSLPTGSFDNYLYCILIFAAYSLAAFVSYIYSKKNVIGVQSLFWVERIIDDSVLNLISFKPRIRKNALTFTSIIRIVYPDSLGTYVSIVLFVVVLFYFILRNS